MTYIDLINEFWKLNKEHPFTATETQLYFKLLDTSNSLGWKNPFSQSNLFICAECNMSEPTLIRVRNSLKQHGLIDFVSGKVKRQLTTYTILGLNKLTLNSSLNDSLSVSLNDSLSGKKSLDNIRLIREDKEKNKTKDTNVSNTPKQNELFEIVFPFESEEFHNAWQMLVGMPKWKKKVNHALQIALKNLGKYDEEFAIELIEKAIEGNYQGVTFPSTPSDYERWKKQKGGFNNGQTKSERDASTRHSNKEHITREINEIIIHTR